MIYSKLMYKVFMKLENITFILLFVFGGAGEEYGIGPYKKFKIAWKIIKNNRMFKQVSTNPQHISMVEDILRVPKKLKGDVVECGCFNGASTISLSLACALTGRKLFVCDSFEGLPAPKADEEYDIHAHRSNYFLWEKGEYASEGGLEGVKSNVERYGSIDCCVFVKGYFKNTLKNLDTESIVLIFEDADIASSVEDCLLYLWPKLHEGCKFYCHEPFSIKIVSLFYDKQWWRSNLSMDPPGFYGSGYGIQTCIRKSDIGYALKFDAEKIKKHGKKEILPGSKGYLAK